jgi:uncharacterized protein YgbK (DUF1537 family)
MGQAVNRGTKEARVAAAIQREAALNAKQDAHTVVYENAVKQVAKSVLKRWEKHSHPLLYADFDLVLRNTPVNDYSEELAKLA